MSVFLLKIGGFLRKLWLLLSIKDLINKSSKRYFCMTNYQSSLTAKKKKKTQKRFSNLDENSTFMWLFFHPFDWSYTSYKSLSLFFPYMLLVRRHWWVLNPFYLSSLVSCNLFSLSDFLNYALYLPVVFADSLFDIVNFIGKLLYLIRVFFRFTSLSLKLSSYSLFGFLFVAFSLTDYCLIPPSGFSSPFRDLLISAFPYTYLHFTRKLLFFLTHHCTLFIKGVGPVRA